ncbi:hypothetical protein OEG84_00395 [Hoeflea sp. G2-23]|uniref:TFIIB-type domain-containing protein n=1 Tax=Hoeflea algicola TaxID=2983763 RepID=A0ABT3Z372_9HYPH|nr:hypothetical protein [Hoeflea algicola]MCY0146215.1 hypothetical protein [Hoeflea algicola]
MIDQIGMRYELPCPRCGEMDQQLISDLVGKDEIACRFCGHIIDLTDEKWQSGFREFLEALPDLYRTK